MVDRISELPADSRIWIYQSDKPIEGDTKEKIKQLTDRFLSQWAAHGQDLLASSEIRENHFLIIAADEKFNAASGCSIDSQFRFIQEIGVQFGIDFFQRSNLAFEKNGSILLVDMKQIKSEIESGKISSNDTFFNNNVKTLAELSTDWKVKINESWLKRYFPASETV